LYLTHLGHACLLVETGKARLLIDPGTLSSGFESLEDLDAILITHEHADHVDADRVRALLNRNPSARLVVDEWTAKQFEGADRMTVAAPGDALDFSGERVEVLGGTHASVYADIPGCPNLAYLVGDGALFHPGDSFLVPPGPVQVLAAPIDGPWLKLSDAVDYVRAVGPETAVPIHEGELTNPAKYAGMLAHFVGDELTVATLLAMTRTSMPRSGDGVLVNFSARE
jgi:L-ascorbate metabolism protein UlaG (beta-lactamase superfamily)